ncbi:hypothetical protein N5079_14785 [Planotetraspora sp. A-T 1434]|uniref:hypothetical protein n=1 Tax=Planotetraspora sp. A-T 1434 TaxID=2979219 RepID=UPI0021BFC35E|nr:hypothetical protein [Planotetraspora sp. A-T 1434]MCT9931484.1 hypothetical protein [Planotetraspora sp. A-T 1434]
MATVILLLATFITAFIGGMVIEAIGYSAMNSWLDGRHQAELRRLRSKLRACRTGQDA